MRKVIVVALLVFVGFAGWRAGGILSPDAMGMAVGIFLGALASLPVALLLLAATRRPAQGAPTPAPRSQPVQHSGQMPLVVFAPPTQPGYEQMMGHQLAQLPGPHPNGWAVPPQATRPERAFTIVGEQAEYVDEY